jgi:phosphopantothenoylcysteine decarboxylase/phosphopantothenate--cysteine ligase
LLGAISKVLGRHGDLVGRKVIVTAGGTQEPIDPVRYIGNRSSGKMGFALASEARDRGADVILISGPVALEAPYGVELRMVETAIQMLNAVHSAITGADVLVMSAAVADFRPATPMAQKLKKDGDEAQEFDAQGGFSLHLVRNPDILGGLAETLDQLEDAQSGQTTDNGKSSKRRKRLVRVGFAAETNEIVTYARTKLVSKHLDLLVANDISRTDSGFGTETNKVFIFHATGEMEDLPVMPKSGVATAIWNRVVPLLSTM